MMEAVQPCALVTAEDTLQVMITMDKKSMYKNRNSIRTAAKPDEVAGHLTTKYFPQINDWKTPVAAMMLVALGSLGGVAYKKRYKKEGKTVLSAKDNAKDNAESLWKGLKSINGSKAGQAALAPFKSVFNTVTNFKAVLYEKGVKITVTVAGVIAAMVFYFFILKVMRPRFYMYNSRGKIVRQAYYSRKREAIVIRCVNKKRKGDQKETNDERFILTNNDGKWHLSTDSEETYDADGSPLAAPSQEKAVIDAAVDAGIIDSDNADFADIVKGSRSRSRSMRTDADTAVAAADDETSATDDSDSDSSPPDLDRTTAEELQSVLGASDEGLLTPLGDPVDDEEDTLLVLPEVFVASEYDLYSHGDIGDRGKAAVTIDVTKTYGYGLPLPDFAGARVQTQFEATITRDPRVKIPMDAIIMATYITRSMRAVPLGPALFLMGMFATTAGAGYMVKRTLMNSKDQTMYDKLPSKPLIRRGR